jgi:DNA-binding phage protein
MSVKSDTTKLELARELITSTNLSIDDVLRECDITHQDYRKVYPDTPMTPELALNILDARELDGMPILKIKRKWSLTTSQLHYALYNDRALQSPDSDLSRIRVTAALQQAKGNRSQTDIAEELGVSQAYVHKIAKECGCLPTNRKKRIVLTALQKELITTAVHNGAPVESLAKSYGVSRDTIYKFMRGNK